MLRASMRSQACVWGAAYRLPPPGAARDAALAYLEAREAQYDVRARGDLHAREAPRCSASEQEDATAAEDVEDADAPAVRSALLCAPPRACAATAPLAGSSHAPC